jgi:hypothetical protein
MFESKAPLRETEAALLFVRMMPRWLHLSVTIAVQHGAISP